MQLSGGQVCDSVAVPNRSSEARKELDRRSWEVVSPGEESNRTVGARTFDQLLEHKPGVTGSTVSAHLPRRIRKAVLVRLYHAASSAALLYVHENKVRRWLQCPGKPFLAPPPTSHMLQLQLLLRLHCMYMWFCVHSLEAICSKLILGHSRSLWSVID
jgi:hypothetical protein